MELSQSVLCPMGIAYSFSQPPSLSNSLLAKYRSQDGNGIGFNSYKKVYWDVQQTEQSVTKNKNDLGFALCRDAWLVRFVIDVALTAYYYGQ